jgi:hypothetical protein
MLTIVSATDCIASRIGAAAMHLLAATAWSDKPRFRLRR